MTSLPTETAIEQTATTYDLSDAAANGGHLPTPHHPQELASIGRVLSRASGTFSQAYGQAGIIVAPAQESGVRAPTRIPRIEHREAKEGFRALYQWEGTVLSFTDEGFVARTRDIVDTRLPDEQVVLPLEDVPKADRHLLRVGAVFYWLIGYEETDDGARKRLSMLRFRRLPGWSKRALERVDSTADELMRMFGPK